MPQQDPWRQRTEELAADDPFLVRARQSAIEEEAAKAGSLPSRVMGGIGTQAVETAQGLFGLAKEAFAEPFSPHSDPLRLLAQRILVDPSIEQFRKARESQTVAGKAGRYLAGSVPVIGPWAASYVDRFQTGEDPAEIAGRGIFDIGTLLAGARAPRTGTRIGTAVEPKKPLIPGAPTTMVEARAPGTVTSLIEGSLTSPTGSGELFRRVFGRNPAIIERVSELAENTGRPGEGGKFLVRGAKQFVDADLRATQDALEVIEKTKEAGISEKVQRLGAARTKRAADIAGAEEAGATQIANIEQMLERAKEEAAASEAKLATEPEAFAQGEILRAGGRVGGRVTTGAESQLQAGKTVMQAVKERLGFGPRTTKIESGVPEVPAELRTIEDARKRLLAERPIPSKLEPSPEPPPIPGEPKTPPVYDEVLNRVFDDFVESELSTMKSILDQPSPETGKLIYEGDRVVGRIPGAMKGFSDVVPKYLDRDATRRALANREKNQNFAEIKKRVADRIRYDDDRMAQVVKAADDEFEARKLEVEIENASTAEVAEAEQKAFAERSAEVDAANRAATSEFQNSMNLWREQMQALETEGGQIKVAEPTGEIVRVTPGKGAKGLEGQLWTRLTQEVKDKGVKPGMENFAGEAADLFAKHRAAYDLAVADVSSSTAAILRRAAKDPEGGLSADLEGAAALRQKISGLIGQEVGDWDAMREVSTKISRLIRTERARSVLGSEDLAALTRLGSAIEKDLNLALETQAPELKALYGQAKNLTKAVHRTYEEGLPRKILATAKRPTGKEPKIFPSNLIENAVKGRPEQAQQLVRAVGPDAFAQRSLRAGVEEYLFSKSRVGRKVDYARVAKNLSERAGTYKALLGDSAFANLQAKIKSQASKQLAERAKIAGELQAKEKAATVQTKEIKEETAKKVAAAKEQTMAETLAAKSRISEFKREAVRKTKAVEAKTEEFMRVRKLIKLRPERAVDVIVAVGDRKPNLTLAGDVKRALASEPEKLRTFQRNVMERLTQSSIEQKGTQKGIFDGPGFSVRFSRNRDLLKELGMDESLLSSWQEFSDEVGRQRATEFRGGKVGALVDKGVLVSTGIGLLTAQIRGAIAAGTYLLTGKTLAKIGMQPEGAHWVAQALKVDKVAPAAGKVFAALADLGVFNDENRIKDEK